MNIKNVLFVTLMGTSFVLYGSGISKSPSPSLDSDVLHDDSLGGSTVFVHQQATKRTGSPAHVPDHFKTPPTATTLVGLNSRPPHTVAAANSDSGQPNSMLSSYTKPIWAHWKSLNPKDGDPSILGLSYRQAAIASIASLTALGLLAKVAGGSKQNR